MPITLQHLTLRSRRMTLSSKLFPRVFSTLPRRSLVFFCLTLSYTHTYKVLKHHHNTNESARRAAPHLVPVLQKHPKVVILSHCGVSSNALQKHLMHGYGLLEQGKILSANQTKGTVLLDPFEQEPLRSEGVTLVLVVSLLHSRLQLLLHLSVLLLAHCLLPLPQTGQLGSRLIKVWFGRGRGNLQSGAPDGGTIGKETKNTTSYTSHTVLRFVCKFIAHTKMPA